MASTTVDAMFMLTVFTVSPSLFSLSLLYLSKSVVPALFGFSSLPLDQLFSQKDLWGEYIQ